MSYVTENPEDQTADVPRQPDWQSAFLENRERKMLGNDWYPVAQAPPETMVPRRFRAFEADEGDFQASISPQVWDCTPNMAVPVNDGAHGNPIEVVPFLPGRASLTITNTGANSILVSPSIQHALNGRGLTVAAGGSFSMDSQASVWAWAVGGASTVQAYWTAYESPTSHLPPKDKD